MSSPGFGELIPIWGWPPALVALFIFGVDFGVIMALRIIVERKFYLTRWWSFRVGDTLGLPVYAGFASVVVRGGHYDGFYTQIWWHVLVLTLGCLLSLAIQINAVRSGLLTLKGVLVASELYHAVVFGVMFYLMTTVLFPLVATHKPVWALALAFVGFGVYAATWVYDNTLVDRTPDGDR